MTTTEFNPRELLIMDYALMELEELEELRSSLMHSMTIAENSVLCWHREYTKVRLAIKEKEQTKGQVTRE